MLRPKTDRHARPQPKFPDVLWYDDLTFAARIVRDRECKTE